MVPLRSKRATQVRDAFHELFGSRDLKGRFRLVSAGHTQSPRVGQQTRERTRMTEGWHRQTSIHTYSKVVVLSQVLDRPLVRESEIKWHRVSAGDDRSPDNRTV